MPDAVTVPTGAWEVTEPDPSVVDVERLHRQIDDAVTQRHADRLGETKALLCVHDGRIVAEGYAADTDRTDTLPSWSMAKSVLGTAVGLLVRDGALALDEPVGRPEWAGDDPRRVITIGDLLRMRDGLDWSEVYAADGHSDVVSMLYGSGQEDVAAYVAARPPVAAPGDRWLYSSGTSNLLAWAACRAVGGGPSGWQHYLTTELFEPIGMTSPILKFDAAGTWLGSTYCFATARDFARFGLLHLREGRWADRQVVPADWVRAMGTTQAQDHDDDLGYGYGLHWWTRTEHGGMTAARGFGGQCMLVVPALDLVIVRLGVTSEDLKANALRWVVDLCTCFASERVTDDPERPTGTPRTHAESDGDS